MKTLIILFPCLALSAVLARGQAQTGTSSSGQGGQTGTTAGQQQSGAGQVDSQQQQQLPSGGASGVIVNDPSGNQIPGGNTNRIQFGGTNQNQFGTTNRGAVINDPSGVNVPPQVPFGTTNQVPFGGPNRGAGLPTNNSPFFGSGTIQEPSGARTSEVIPPRPGYDTNRVNAASDALFAQQLNAALARGGATKVYFPQTRSTITLVNQNGSIMLQGFVSSEEEKQQIEARVRNSAGVTAVNNFLRVGPPTQNRPVSPIPNNPAANENERQLLNP